jgi:hypothetical protein
VARRRSPRCPTGDPAGQPVRHGRGPGTSSGSTVDASSIPSTTTPPSVDQCTPTGTPPMRVRTRTWRACGPPLACRFPGARELGSAVVAAPGPVLGPSSRDARPTGRPGEHAPSASRSACRRGPTAGPGGSSGQWSLRRRALVTAPLSAVPLNAVPGPRREGWRVQEPVRRSGTAARRGHRSVERPHGRSTPPTAARRPAGPNAQPGRSGRGRAASCASAGSCSAS